MNFDFIVFLAVLILSVVVHEVAHAWQAYREGDSTAHDLGRITLNPLPHLDFVGSFLVPAILFATNSGILFGWAKPVPVNPANFRVHPWGDIRVSLAGIVSNLILALVFFAVTALTVAAAGVLGPFADVVQRAGYFGMFINLLLAFFNLIPLPPLDGSHVVANLLPPRAAVPYRRLGRYGVPILFLLVLFLPGLLSAVLSPVTWVMGVADTVLRSLA